MKPRVSNGIMEVIMEKETVQLGDTNAGLIYEGVGGINLVPNGVDIVLWKLKWFNRVLN